MTSQVKNCLDVTVNWNTFVPEKAVTYMPVPVAALCNKVLQIGLEEGWEELATGTKGSIWGHFKRLTKSPLKQ